MTTKLYISLGVFFALLFHTANFSFFSVDSSLNDNKEKALMTLKDKSTSPAYKNPELATDARVSDLLKKMTIEEKVAQMNCYPVDMMMKDGELDNEKLKVVLKHGIGQLRDHHKVDVSTSVELHNAAQKFLKENTRLGIPAIIHGEGLHGYVNYDATSFPQALSMAQTWNLELIGKVYTTIAKETRSRGVQQLLTPVLDIARDPRWGRFSETYGEDPWLSAEVGKQVVMSFQGRDDSFLDNEHVIATLKHFPAHGSSYGGFNCAPALVNDRLLRNVQMYPFTKCIQEANAVSVMAMYGEIDGIPVHSSEYILKDVLRKEIGFTGFVVSDYGAIELLKTGPQWEFHRHHVAADSVEAALLAVKAGVNTELVLPHGYTALLDLVKQNKITEKEIDALIKPMLAYKFKLRLFDNPYVDAREAVAIASSEETDALALQAAKEAVIMLKNKNNTAPLSESELKTIAVIGPNANRELLGDYSTERPRYFSTVLDGIQERVGKNTKVLYHEGCKITPQIPENKEQLEKDKKSIEEAVKTAQQAEVIIAVVGGDRNTAREGRDRSDLDLVGFQEELLNKLFELNKPVILCLIGGIPYAIPHIYDKADVVYQCWNLGQETGNGLAAVIFGDYNPSAKLTVTIPRSVGHIPVFYNKKPTAFMREYLYDPAPGGYCYPFGFGKSYTSYQYSNLRLEKSTINAGEEIKAFIDVKNSGEMEGTEIVQLYIHDRVASITRPMKELKAFKRVDLKPGESKTAELTVPVDDLAFYGKDMKRNAEPGDFNIMVGSSSRDEDLLKTTITLTE
jgi:beta-glucosidase